MTKTYRALGVAANVALVCLALHAVYLIEIASQPSQSGPVTDVPALVLIVIWPYTIRLFAPILSTFSVVVASQSRAWRWLIALVVAGIIGTYGIYVTFFVTPVNDLFLRFDLSLHNNMPPAGSLAEDIFNQVILQAIPAVAALIFVGMKLRASANAQELSTQFEQA